MALVMWERWWCTQLSDSSSTLKTITYQVLRVWWSCNVSTAHMCRESWLQQHLAKTNIFPQNGTIQCTKSHYFVIRWRDWNIQPLEKKTRQKHISHSCEGDKSIMASNMMRNLSDKRMFAFPLSKFSSQILLFPSYYGDTHLSCGRLFVRVVPKRWRRLKGGERLTGDCQEVVIVPKVMDMCIIIWNADKMSGWRVHSHISRTLTQSSSCVRHHTIIHHCTQSAEEANLVPPGGETTADCLGPHKQTQVLVPAELFPRAHYVPTQNPWALLLRRRHLQSYGTHHKDLCVG